MAIKLGIIAEDKSDVEVLEKILAKIAPGRAFSTKHFVGHGCGKLKRKCRDWAHMLMLQGCSHLIVLHDLDKNVRTKLNNQIRDLLNPCPISRHLIVIPVEELEAWLIADAEALRRAFSLKSTPKPVTNPETIRDPKEKIREVIWKTSGHRVRYLNTVHNTKIATHIRLEALRHCSAFIPLESFWKAA